jgi:SAM-dependent methyltransferase
VISWSSGSWWSRFSRDPWTLSCGTNAEAVHNVRLYHQRSDIVDKSEKSPGERPLAAQPWYNIVEKHEAMETRAEDGENDKADADAESEEEGTAIFESRHPSQRYVNVLSLLRCHYPPGVWHAISKLFPRDRKVRPVCVDIAVGAEGRGGVELARRGFHVIGVEADPQLLAQTFQFAQAHDAHIELMTAKVEHSLLSDGSADLVTFFHGLHLVDTAAGLREAWRILRPGGRLVAAWNDRSLSSPFIQELEDVMEKHVTTYNRYQKQREVEEWGERLQEGGLFRLIEYSVHANPIPMHSASALLDVLDCMSFIRAALKRGEARKRFNNDVRCLLERRFGRHQFSLPLETKMYVLEKVVHSDNLEESLAGADADKEGSRKGLPPLRSHKTLFSADTPREGGFRKPP